MATPVLSSYSITTTGIVGLVSGLTTDGILSAGKTPVSAVPAVVESFRARASADWLFDYVSDALDVLPQEDRDAVADFWQGLIQIVASVQQRSIETDINRYIDYVQPFRTERWQSYTLNLATATISETSPSVTFSPSGGSLSVAQSALLRWGLLCTRTADGTVYRLDVDFSIDFVAGTATHIAGGAIPVGAPLTIRYYYMSNVGPFAGFPYAVSVDAKTYSIPVLQTDITPTTSTTFLYENVDYVVGAGFLAFASPPPTTWAERTLLDDQTPWRNFGALIDFYIGSSPEYVSALQGLYYAYFTGSQIGTIENAVALLAGLPVALDGGTITSILDTTTDVPINSVTKPYTIITDGSVDLTTLLSADSLVRVIGTGAYTHALPVASVTADTVVLRRHALASATPMAATLRIPRQIRYQSDTNRIRIAEVYDGLTLRYGVGDTVAKWAALTDGATIIDKVVDPDVVINEVGRAGLQRFLTDAATVGTGPGTDETAALTLLASNLWVMQLNGSIFNYILTFGNIKTFLDRVKPAYTEYILTVLESFSEPIGVDEREEPLDVIVDLTYTVNSNYPNHTVWATAIAVASWDQATRVVTVVGHDLNELGNVGEIVEMRGFGGDDGEYLIQSIALFPGTTMILLQTASASYGAGVGEVIVPSTSEEYIAAGGYPDLNIGAGHIAVDSALIFDFEVVLDEIEDAGAAGYLLHASAGAARFDIFVEVGDAVVVTNASNPLNNKTYTVAEVVDSDTLRVVESVITEPSPIGGGAAMTITKTR